MYGLWLYKDLATEYGKCRVEIHQKEYNGESIEIEAFAGDSLSIALDNLSEIISPIGKSVCSFGIINTNQFNYDILFTPDATKFMVVVKTMVTGQEWITRWSGFLTPDFFAEDLQYRSIISLSARDGIGQLNDIDFTYDGLLLTIQTLIQTAFSKVSPEYPMEVVIDTKKVIDGYTLDSVYIASDLFKGKSWGEAIETVLHDCGLQMRWIDNNTIAIYDLSAMPEQFANQSVQFINGSGYREILPAWKTLSQNQDYKTRGNLYDGVANAELMVLDHSELAYYPFGGAPQQNYVNYYKLLSQWTTAWNAYTGKNMNDPLSGVYISGAIDAKEKEQNYIFYKRDIQYSNYPVKIKLKTSKTIHYCEAPSLYPETLAPYDLYNPADPDNTGYVQLSLFVSIILHADNGQDYYLGREWYQYNNTSQGMSVMKFTLNQATYGNISAEDIEIEAQGIPYNGELSIRIHGYQMEDFKYVRVNDNYPYPDWNAFFAKIEDVTIEFDNNNLPSGVNMGVTINEAHNIKKDEDYTLNTLPNGIGGETAIVNGLYNSNGNSLYFAQLNNQTEEYTLLELVGREAIHYNIKNYEKLSGDIKAVDNKPLLFNSCYKYNGKTFIPYAYSLSVISNTMNITSMQEVEPYVTAELTEIHSEIATGGGSTVGGGNNIALQYSSNAGNAKRIYELDNASEDDVKGAYIVVDKAGLTEAKKFNLQDIAEMTDWFTLEELSDGEKVLKTKYNLASEKSISWRGVSTSGGGTSGGGLIQRVYGYDNITDVFDDNTKTDTFNAYTIAKIAERVSDIEKNGVGGDVDLTGYATENWVLSKDYATNTAVANLQLAHNTLRSEFDALNNVLNDDVSGKINTWNEVVDFLDEYSGSQDLATILAGINGDISSLQGKFNKDNIQTTLGIADWALAASKPSYDFSEILNKPTTLAGYGITDALSTSGGTITGRTNIKFNGWPFIAYYNSSTLYGYIGFSDVGVPSMYNGTSWNTLYHSGNFNPADYLPKSGGTIEGVSEYPLTINSTAQQTYLKIVNNNAFKAAFGYISNTGAFIYHAGLNKYLGIRDNGTPHFAGNTLIHTGNYTDTTDKRYLQLSGGTISSDSQGVLSVNSNATAQTAINIDNANVNRGLIGWTPSSGIRLYNAASARFIGIKDDGTPYYHDGSYNTLIHSGNIGSQSVNYATSAGDADTLDGKHATDLAIFLYNVTDLDANDVPNGIYGGKLYGCPNWLKNYYAFLSVGAENYKMQFNGVGNRFFYRAGDEKGIADKAWREVAFLDSNVASAYKLITENNKWVVYLSNVGNLVVGDNIATGQTHIIGNDIILRYGTAASYGFILNSSGNALIGTTTDDGVNKLQVNGSMRASFGQFGSILINKGYGDKFGDRTIETNTAGAMLYINYYHNGGLNLCQGGGNVLIGTATDRGHKLTINSRPSEALTSTTLNNSSLFIGLSNTLDSHGMNLWTEGNGTGFIQQGRTDEEQPKLYNLSLQPFGGNVLIGKTTDDGTSKLQVAGNISATGSISWGAASDRRLKDNIKTISNEDAINVIMALNPVTFEWNKTATEKDNSLKGLSCGFVADEYTKVIPNSSRPIWEEYDAIDYKLTAAFVVKGLQSHEERLRVLERENRELKNELNKLRGYGNC